MSDLFASLATWILNVVESLGYVGLTLLIVAETVFPPLPSEAILPVAGILASQDRLNLAGVLVASTVGSVAGATLLYWFGLAYGEARLRRFVEHHGKWFLLDTQDLERAQAWFGRYGGRAVILGRLMPLIRSLVSLPAGVARMRLWRFCLYTGLGSGLWNSFLAGSGYVLGQQWPIIQPYTRLLEIAAVVGIVGSGLFFIWRRRGRLASLARKPARLS